METIAVYNFADAINRHDLAKIDELMTEDHVFIDALGNRMDRTSMREGWKGYFQWYPDYKIELNEVFCNEKVVAAFGYASGTYKNLNSEKKGNYWRLPASWRVEVVNDKIKVWQVYADTKVPFDIMGRNK